VSPPLQTVTDLAASPFERSLDLRWRRTSYSDITTTVHDAWVTSEPEEPLISDEPPAPVPVSPDSQADADGGGGPVAEGDQVALSAMAVGVQVGTFIHRLLEATDFTAADLDAELAGQLAAVQARRAVDVGDLEAVARGLRDAIETPLGPVFDGLRLRDFKPADRLDELTFELPLAGGDDPGGWAELSRLAAILDEFVADGDPLAGYSTRLRDGDLRQSVRGYLTGSLDLVIRLPGLGGSRFAVIDYKTNWLGELDAPLTASQYRARLLAVEIQRHHYALQALLYLVALHRYLRWRLAGYDPDEHIAGVGYLFLRGMTGPDVQVLDGSPCGVFGWRPPQGLVQALSDALDGGDDPR
jgi:exodeoxyribonuclease V beta subunit